ncbi:hypothetical protein ACFV30_34105 [Streptomyces sp. NPDC059752]|uniref:hypothetical protein n=1 Tax=unclassified Streptomyces TaxID=2593676 RepID=UPI00365C529E
MKRHEHTVGPRRETPPTRTVIPHPASRIPQPRPSAFDRETYKQQNTADLCINKLKQWRGPATRYDKTGTIYLAALFVWSAR